MTPQPDLPAEVAEALHRVEHSAVHSSCAATIRAHIASLDRQLAEARWEHEGLQSRFKIADGLLTAIANEMKQCGVEMQTGPECRLVNARAESAERQLAEVTARAEMDAKRLDWLDGQALFYPPTFGKSWGLYVADSSTPLRAAIDAASAAREGE